LKTIYEALVLKIILNKDCYGQGYSELICVLIPSKKGLKLGFNKGPELPDPTQLLEGTGKISRYVQIKSKDQLHAPALKNLLVNALAAYHLRKEKKASK
jgi:hypothetical protein